MTTTPEILIHPSGPDLSQIYADDVFIGSVDTGPTYDAADYPVTAFARDIIETEGFATMDEAVAWLLAVA